MSPKAPKNFWKNNDTDRTSGHCHKSFRRRTDRLRSAAGRLRGLSGRGACPAAGLCGMKENKEQIFSVAVADSSAYNSGDSVIVTLNPRLGWISVLFCYALPLFLMLLTLFSGRYFGQNEIFSGITAIIVLIPYYFLLFLGRNYFKKKFTFKITRQ